MTIFGREPALVLKAVQAALAVLVAFGVGHLTSHQAGAILAVVSAVLGIVTAWAVRPVAPAVWSTAVTSVTAVLTSFGLSLPADQVSAVQVAVLAVVALLVRAQVSPARTLDT